MIRHRVISGPRERYPREAVSALSSDIRKSLTTQPRGMSHRPQCRCRTGSATVLSWKDYSLNSFNGFGLAEPILTALTEERYVTPTPIQAQSIPILLSGRDLIGIAQTGTGKTA